MCENGPSIYIDVTWRHIGEGEFFGAGVRGVKGSASLNPLRVWKEMHGVTHDVSPAGSVGRENPYIASIRAQWAHFLAVIRGDVPAPPLHEHVMVPRVLDAIYKSAADGRDVILLLDGLDEVANEDERAEVRQCVEDLVSGRAAMRVVLTCRTVAPAILWT